VVVERPIPTWTTTNTAWVTGLIRQMSRENLTWGQRRIANELQRKLGLRVSPRTVGKYRPKRQERGPGRRVQCQRWRTCLCNQAQGLIVRGAVVEFVRDMKALLTHMIWRFQRWRDRHRLTGSPSASHPGCTVASPDGIRLMPNIELLHMADGVRGVERSPPVMGLSRRHEPSPAAQALPGSSVEVRAAVSISGWRDMAGPKAQGVESVRKGGM
jgi:hypothetical protein